jgi:dihydrofolate reductase
VAEVTVSRLIVSSFGLSIDGFGAGPEQSLDNPLGVGGPGLMEWAFTTRTFQQMHGGSGGSTGVDEDFAARGFANVGAWILGRNMFGPVRGPWPDDEWKGWWGANPPYHVPVFVLTHHPREPVPMEGGTTFHFVTDGNESALEQAREAAGDGDVQIAGGANVVQQYLTAGVVDEFQVHVAPVFLGGGVRLFNGLGHDQIKLEVVRAVESPLVTHLKYRVL